MPSGVTAPRPVITTLRLGPAVRVAHAARLIRPADDQVDRVADGLQLLHVLALEHDAVIVLDDLRELDQVERVDVELLERRRRGVIWLGVGAEARKRLDDPGLDLLCCDVDICYSFQLRCILCRQPAVNGKHRTGDVAGLVGNQEADARRDLLGGADTARGTSPE